MIPFENFLSSSQAYFSYEENLHLYDPVITNMVSERYRCAAIHSDYDDKDFEDEDHSDSDIESETEEEEEFSDPRVADSISDFGIIFGSFVQDSNLDTVPVAVAPMIPFKPVIHSCTINIGEITCFLVAIIYDASINFSHNDQDEDYASNSENLLSDANKEAILVPPWLFLDPKVKVEEKLQKVQEETPNQPVLSEIAFSTIDHHHDGIDFVVADLLFNAKIIAPSNINNGSRFAGSKFYNDLMFFASDLVPSCLDSENHVTVESDFVFSDLHGAGINVFDPGGTDTIMSCVPSRISVYSWNSVVFDISVVCVIVVIFYLGRTLTEINYSVVALSSLSRVGIFIFDPGGNHRQPPRISLLSTSTFSPAPPWFRSPALISVGSCNISSLLWVPWDRGKMGSNMDVALSYLTSCHTPTRVRTQNWMLNENSRMFQTLVFLPLLGPVSFGLKSAWAGNCSSETYWAKEYPP